MKRKQKKRKFPTIRWASQLKKKIVTSPTFHRFVRKYSVPIKKWSRFLFLIILSFGLYAYAMVQGGFLSWFLFYSFIPFLLYAFILFIYPLSDFYTERVVASSDLSVGQSISIHIKVRRKQNFPLFFFSVRDGLPIKIQQNHTTTIGKGAYLPLFRREFTLSYTIPNLPRGEHLLSEMQLKIHDPLSLIVKQKNFQVTDSIIVYPKIKRTSFHQAQSEFELGRNINILKRRQESNIVSKIREYQPGDKLSTIDWKSTAKKSELMSKDFEEKNSQDLLVIVNSFSQPPIFEELVSYAASIIDTDIRTNGKAGLVIVGKNNVVIPSRDTKEQRARCMIALAKVEADLPEQCTQLFTLNSVHVTRQGSLVLLTSILTKEVIFQLTKVADQNLQSYILFFKNHADLSPLDHQLIAYAKGLQIQISLIPSSTK